MSLTLNLQQHQALAALEAFLASSAHDVFVLRGSAGTGKSTLIGRLVEQVRSRGLRCALAAPTGRAARVLEGKVALHLPSARVPATTLHSTIYALDDMEVDDQALDANDPGVRWYFPLRAGAPPFDVLVVDEASMVGDHASRGGTLCFGTGALLSDLITYLRLRQPPGEHPVRLVLVGDPVQLPPVGEMRSPALDADHLARRFGLGVAEAELTQVMRQGADSAILDQACTLRDAVKARACHDFALPANRPDIRHISTIGAIALAAERYRAECPTPIIVHTNHSALRYNRAVRARLWGSATLPVRAGDRLLVNRNNPLYDLNNGDAIQLLDASAATTPVTVHVRVKGGSHAVTLLFRDVTLGSRQRDGTLRKQTCTMLENLLDAAQGGLPALTQRALLVEFRQRHKQLDTRSDAFKQAMLNDARCNALQTKYGYAMTCHKAQGGEWEAVIVDFSGWHYRDTTPFFRWAYTAITRAVTTLHAVAAPSFARFDQRPRPGNLAAAPRQAPITPTHATTLADPVAEHPTTAPAMAAIADMRAQRERLNILRAAWRTRGIDITRHELAPTFVRCELARGNDRVTVHYHCNTAGQVVRHGMVPGSTCDAALARDALAAFSLTGTPADTASPEPFIQRFAEHLDRALAPSALRRTSLHDTNCGVRVGIADATRRGTIDFLYDGRRRWRRMREATHTAAGQAIYRDVRQLLAATAAARPS